MAMAVAAVAVLPYLGGGPVWDDRVLLVEGLSQLPLRDLGDLWTSAAWTHGPGSGYYRPTALTVLAILSRQGVGAVHLAALALHVGSTGILAWLLGGASRQRQEEGEGDLAVLPGALLFAVHPLASEALGWASALPDLLAVHLALFSVLAARTSWILAFPLVLLSLLSKESALLVLPAACLARLAPPKAWIPWSLGALGALAARVGAGAGGHWHLEGKAGFVPTALAWSWGSLVFPWPLTPVRDLWVAPPWVLPLGLAAVLAGVLWAGRCRGAWAGLLLALAGPVLALPPTLDGYLAAERYSYVSIVGLALLVAWRGRSRDGWRLAGLAVPLALVLHFLQAPSWRTDLALFGRAVDVLPQSSFARHFLGVSQMEAGLYEEAAGSFEMSFRNGHPLDVDRRLKLQALVLAGRAPEALAWAESGPRSGLEAVDLAWWARAARDAGELDRARVVLSGLWNGQGWDGPGWVPSLARELAPPGGGQVPPSPEAAQP